MSQQQFQAEVMDELRQLDEAIEIKTDAFTQRIMDMISEAYIAGWKQGMSDAKGVKYDD